VALIGQSMFFPKRYKKRNAVKGMKTLSGVFLLFLYLAGNVQIDGFHQLFHAKDELHSVEQELDPCHRAIYHDAEKDGCGHKTHLTEIKKCPLCHVVPHNAQHLSSSHSVESFSLPNIFDDASCAIHVGEIFNSLSARGPPLS